MRLQSCSMTPKQQSNSCQNGQIDDQNSNPFLSVIKVIATIIILDPLHPLMVVLYHNNYTCNCHHFHQHLGHHYPGVPEMVT